jgi:hypothetical protein
MIFGFNTDVKHGDTIYHVQSEARESERLLQTQVFVRGRCVGKRATSYAAKPADTASGDAHGDTQKEQQLREQHRLVLDAIREGKLESVLDGGEPEVLAAVKELDVQWRLSRGRRAPHFPLRASGRGAVLHAGRHRCWRFG